nr:hypothetical protein [Tanacetum cinerariifolium]
MTKPYSSHRFIANCFNAGNLKMEVKDPDENSSQSTPQIDHQCCYGCGDSLDEIFCQQCTCKSCGKGAHYGFNCSSKVPIISNPKPCHNQNVDEFPQTLPSFHPTCYSGDENSFAYDLTPNFFNDSLNVFNPPSQPPIINDSMIELRETFQAWLQQRKDQVVNLDFYSPKLLQCRKIPICYDDDDDEKSSTPLRDIIIFKLHLCIAITPVLSTKEPKDSLIMGEKHLDTILEKKSDEFIKFTVENLVPNPTGSEDEQSLLNQDSLIISSSKIDSLLDEFTGEHIFLKSIPPRIDESDCDPEEEIRLIKKLLYDNSSPRPLEEINFENSDAVIESFFPSPIPFEDSDPFMEEIDLFLTSDGSIPPDIDSDYSNSEGDNLFPGRLLHNDLIPLPDIFDFSNVVRNLSSHLYLSGDFFNSSLLRE